MHPAELWQVGPRQTLRLDEPRLIGVLNVTPDSFSDAGKYPSVAAAVEYAGGMLESGACMIDVGGESTRPGAVRVRNCAKIAGHRSFSVPSNAAGADIPRDD